MQHAVVGVMVNDQVKPFTLQHLLHGCTLWVMSPITESNNFGVKVASIEKHERRQAVDVYGFPNGAEAPEAGRRYGFAELIVNPATGSVVLRLELPEKIRH